MRWGLSHNLKNHYFEICLDIILENKKTTKNRITHVTVVDKNGYNPKFQDVKECQKKACSRVSMFTIYKSHRVDQFRGFQD